MGLFLKLRSRRLFISLFLSFLLFLLIPVAVFFTTFYYDMIGYYESEISNSTLSKLTIVKNTIDGKFAELEQNAIRISTDQSLYLNILNELPNAGTPKDTDSLFKVKKIQDVLSNIENINPFIQSVYIYSRDSNLLLKSDEGIYNTAQFPDKAWIEQYYNDNQKKLFIGSRQIPQFSWDKESQRNVITLVYPLISYTNLFNGSIAININEDSLYPFIHSGNTDDSSFTFISDKTGKLFLYDRNSFVNNITSLLNNISKQLISKSGSGHFLTTIGSVQYLITYSWSTETGLVYIGASPIKSLFNHANLFKITVTLISVVILILGLASSYLISNRIYRPILQIVEILKSHRGTNIAGYKNELQLISGTLTDIMQESQKMSGILERKEKDLKQLHVLNLINGNSENNEYDYQFLYNHFVCIVISIDKYYEFTRRYSLEEQYVLKQLLLKGCEDLIQKQFFGIGAALERDKIVFILNLTPNQAAVPQKWITSVYEEWEKEILRKHQLTLSVGIGSVYVGKKNIMFSYLEALDAVKYKLIQGYGSIIVHSDLSIRSHDELYYPISRETRIFNYLDIRKQEELNLEIKELIDYYRQHPLSYDNIIHMIYQLVGNTIKYLLVSVNQQITDIFPGHHNLYNELSEKETLEEIGNWLLWFYGAILDHLGKETQINNRHIQDVVSFIQQNFKRSDIDLTTISEATGLSYPHLRKIFKNHIGLNVTDYIHNLRIKEGKRLLLETEMTIKEIAEQTGYTNDQSFTRNFRKSEGITPGEFRNKGRLIIS